MHPISTDQPRKCCKLTCVFDMADSLLPGAFWFDDIDAGGAPLLDLELDVSILETFENNVQEDTGGSQGKSCDAAPKRKKRGRKPLSEQERQQRAEKDREANRLQQARYRQRQKVGTPRNRSCTREHVEQVREDRRTVEQPRLRRSAVCFALTRAHQSRQAHNR